MTPTEGWIGKKIWVWVKEYARRYALLEERVKALETTLEKQPADTCQFCGERAMRMKSANGVAKRSDGKQVRIEQWQCEKCDKQLESVTVF